MKISSVLRLCLLFLAVVEIAASISHRSIGEKELLVVRVEARDGSKTSASTDKLIRDIFQDDETVVTQFKDCSKNQFLLKPAEGSSNIKNGVITVYIDQAKGLDAAIIYQQIDSLSQSSDYFGRQLKDFHQVAICMPPGVTSLRYDDEEDEQKDSNKWIAFNPEEYEYKNFMTIYNDEWCSSVSAMMHEMGHTMGLQHSGENNSYDDETGHMGASFKAKKNYRKCFNPAQSWQLGWYDQTSLRLDPLLDESKKSTVVVMGITTDIPVHDKNKYHLVQIDNGDEGDLYIGYNLQDSFNADTNEGEDKLLVNLQQSGTFRNSRLLAKLDENETFQIENYRGIPGATLVIRRKDRVFKGRGVQVEIDLEYNEDTSSSSDACGKHQARFEVAIVTDEYPEDTSWTLTNDQTGAVVASRYTFYEAFRSESDSVCLDKDGSSYTLEVFDSHEDGLCCDFGFGGYQGFLDGKPLFRGGEFESIPSVKHSFVALTNEDNSIDVDTASTRGACEDDSDYLFNNKYGRDCEWVGRIESRRIQKCNGNDPKTTLSLKHHCPSVCRDSCQIDKETAERNVRNRRLFI